MPNIGTNQSGGNPFDSMGFAGSPFGAQNKPTATPLNLFDGGNNPFDTFRAQTTDLKTPKGLFKMAQSAGLETDARRVVANAGGESGKYMSGGFLMDGMDLLNTFSYGMVGLVKGKGFIEGVKNRESLSDQDALGQYGFVGKVAGMVGDILLDPMTYVSPLKLVSKIPGVASTLEQASTKLFGELLTIEVQGQKTFHREGGWTPLTFLSDKLVYGYAVGKDYLNGMERTAGRNDALLGEADNILQKMGKIGKDTFDSTLTRAEDGSIMSKPLSELEVEMKRAGKDKEFENIKELYDFRDALMQRQVDRGVISADAVDKHWGTYLTNTYDEYLAAKKTGGSSRAGIGIDSKSRVEGLTDEMRKEKGQVEDPSVVWGTTFLKQIKNVKNADLQHYLSSGYALDDKMLEEFTKKGGDVNNLYKVPDTIQYRMVGKEADLTKELGNLNQKIKSTLKERKVIYKDNVEVKNYISNLENQMSKLKDMHGKDLSEGISGVRQVLRDGGLSQGAAKKVPTSDGQKIIASEFSKWLNSGSKSDRLIKETLDTKSLLAEFRKTPGGLVLERAFNDPKMMYQWKSPSEFIDAIRHPDRAKVISETKSELVPLTEEQQLAKVKSAEAHARKYGSLEQTHKVLKDTNLKLIEDSVNKIEDHYSDLLFEKSGILKTLEENQYGNLAGKYVSKEVWNTVKGTFNPTQELGEKIVMNFKHATVIWNPASQIRNAFSASIQNWWELGLGPWRVDTYYNALREFKNNGKYLNEMKSLGFNERSGYINELLDNYMTNKDLVGKSLANSIPGGTTVKQFGKHIDRLMMDTYGHSDNVARVAAYMHSVKQGLSKEEAYAKAIAAQFNYSQVTPLVRQMRKAIWGVPFITFGLKAAPLVGRTIVENPGRISVFGKARNDLFKAAGVEGTQEEQNMPAYMRDDMFVMKLPWKDSNNRSMYFDLSYILPFGALMDGSYLKNPISANPVLQMVSELAKNKTFSGNKVFNESDDTPTVIADISAHIMKTSIPGPIKDTMSDGYAKDGTRVPPRIGTDKFMKTNTQDLGPGERSFYQETFRLLGMGATPYELNSKEAALAYRQQENLTQLLQQKGVLKTFQASYLPKDSQYRPGNEPFTPATAEMDPTIPGR